MHKDPGLLPNNRTEQSPDGKTKLDEFRALVQKKMCRFWESPADLGSQVSRSLVKLIKTTPAIGWVRGDLVPSQSAAQEMLQLKEQIDRLKAKLEDARTTAPEGSSKLQQDEDMFDLGYTFVASPNQYRSQGKGFNTTIGLSWNDIFAAVAPAMIDEVDDVDDVHFKANLDRLVQQRATSDIRARKGMKDKYLLDFSTTRESVNTIKVQLRALGLITKSQKNRSVKDTSTYWSLTPYGDTIMTRLLAKRRDEHTESVRDSEPTELGPP